MIREQFAVPIELSRLMLCLRAVVSFVFRQVFKGQGIITELRLGGTHALHSDVQISPAACGSGCLW